MKNYIKDILRQRLNEVHLGPHFIERMEDRVWGNKPPEPATINAMAWADPSKYPTETVIDANGLRQEVPVTNYAKSILDKIKFLQNDVDFNTRYPIGIVFWKSGKIERGGHGWGNTLVGLYRPEGSHDCKDCMTVLQWQPAKDVYGGTLMNPEYVISFDDLQKYVMETGIRNLTEKDIHKIKHSQKVDTTQKSEDIILSLGGVKYAIDFEKGILYPKNKIADYKAGRLTGELKKLDDYFDSLPSETQDKILTKMDELS